MPSEPSVFLSYSSQDEETARRLVRDLQARGVRVWFDRKEILAGDSIVDRIQEGLHSSEYLIVLISQHSLHSKWVQMALDRAFATFPDATDIRIIPVLLDGSEIPPEISRTRYVDLTGGYDAGLRELLKRFEPGRASGPRVDQIINVQGLAQDLGAEKKVSRGAEFFVTTVTGVMTVLATLLTAIPGLQTMVGNRPRVYFAVSHQQLTMPPGTNEQEIRKLLQEKGFADSVLRLTLVNKGDAKAGEIKIGADVAGTVARIDTDPSEDSNPVWVRISGEKVSPNKHSSRVSFNDLVPNKIVDVSVWYYSSGANYSADVVADGQLATRVADVSLIPQWSLFEAFRTPLVILAVGLVIAVLGGVFTAAMRNPRLGRQLVDVVEVVSPVFGRLLRVLVP